MTDTDTPPPEAESIDTLWGSSGKYTEWPTDGG